jgi:Uma2 family endonuclease
MTGAQFDAMPYDKGRRWELINGELIPVPSPTPRHQDIAFEITAAIRGYLKANHPAGLAYQDVEFALTGNDRLRPDVCILLSGNASRLDPDKIPIPGAPDIAIEVIFPTERASESHDKVRAYLRHGTAEVWQVYPKSRTVQIHRGDTARILEWSQPIETDLLPGFSLQLASLF